MTNVTTRGQRDDTASRADLFDEDEWDQNPDEPDPLDPFFAGARITEVVGELKSGKEGTVYLCRANPSIGHDLVAAKVYRPRTERTFRNDAVYGDGRSYGKARENRAVKNKSRLGRELQQGEWLRHEWETLRLLWSAGAPVPQPIALAPAALLMAFIGEGEVAAPALQQIRPRPEEVRPLCACLLDTMELFLACNTVHGDLSPYNILYAGGQVTVIDFPQAVDPRSNRNALDLLSRDVENVCAYFIRHGMNLDPTRITSHLWSRFLRMEL